jgi:hypothetical protein
VLAVGPATAPGVPGATAPLRPLDETPSASSIWPLLARVPHAVAPKTKVSAPTAMTRLNRRGAPVLIPLNPIIRRSQQLTVGSDATTL